MMGRARPTWRDLAASCVGIVALLATGLAHPSPARADLGSYTPYDGLQPHQGGFESAPTTSAGGVYALILNKTPDLCNGPMQGDSGSTEYAMLTNYAGPPRWYQVGWFRGPTTGSCSVAYMQYYDLSTFTFDLGPCVPAGVAYRYVIKNLGGLNGWAAYVLRDSDGTKVWGAPHDPIGLGFTIEDAEYSSEVINEADQAGGGNSSRSYLDGLKWYDSNLNPVNANIPSADRFCQMCNPSTDGFPVGPYNTNWAWHGDNRSFQVWTDGF